jgi:hypothetical protein
VEHIPKFVAIWEMVTNIELSIEIKDTITWKFINGGKYSASSAYQFEGTIFSTIHDKVWKILAPLKCKFFA